MEIGLQDLICSTRQPSLQIYYWQINLITECPIGWLKLQMSNVLTYWLRSKIYIIENIYVTISVEKYKENTKWEMHGELFKILIYWQYLFCKEIMSKINFIKTQFFTNWICLLTEYWLKSAFLWRNCKIEVQN